MPTKKIPATQTQEEGDVSTSNGELVFDLDRVTVPVKVGDKHYELKEATGDAAARWRNAILSKTKLGPDGKPVSVGDIADTEPILVSLCLYPKDSDRNVGTAEVRSWPARIVKQLFEKAKDISDLDETDDDEEDVAKNEQTGTPVG